MELAELLKIINDQAGKADTQAQLEAMRQAIQKIHEIMLSDNKTDVLVFGIFLVMVIVLVAVDVYNHWKIDKRLKKLELASGLKKS